MESSLLLLQTNVLNRHRWATRDEMLLSIIVWIERTYRRPRRQADSVASRRSSTRPSTRLRSDPPPKTRCYLLVQQTHVR